MNALLLNELIACPVCKSRLSITAAAKSVVCTNCRNSFAKGQHTWIFIPQGVTESSPWWQMWQELQSNSIVGYKADPKQNLSVGERDDCRRFAKFCRFEGLVLDVGCGPQPWPAYFDRARNATYIGVDPLADDSPSEFQKFTALGEYLPFQADIFNHILFSTTLDHFVDPLAALEEAKRVCRPDGEIDIWLGEKHPDTPKPAHSPDWYLGLKKPDMAEDLFHVKRLNSEEMEQIVEKSGLNIAEHQRHQVDLYRTHHFYRLKCRK